MTLRIVADRCEKGTTIRLIGRMQSEHVEHVRAEIAGCQQPAVLDLDELLLADVQAVRFLVDVERAGVVLRRCPPFVREWMNREGGRMDESS